MNKEKINKAQIIESVNKMVTDKKIVRSYLRGKTTIKTVNTKGIKLANPL